MCGLFGIKYLASSAKPDEVRLRQSVDSLSHRGPDATAVISEKGLGLGHKRLALVDTSERSNQPMTDASGRYSLIFNGEIYNFRELRADLENHGYVFKTTSDTEVVLNALIHHGIDGLALFNGMFGLAFADRKTGSVLLARDRFGMKPLFWSKARTDKGDALLFGSEVKSLAPWIDLQADIGSLSAYLMRFGGPTSGKTFYQGVRQLKPGTRLLYTPEQGIEIEPFFALTEFLDDAEIERLNRLRPDQVADEFDGLMQEAIKSQLFADAKVGAFCSGGVDSSLIVSMAAHQKQDVSLFHANVKGSWSEYDHAAALAKHLKLDIHCVEVEEQDFVDLIPKVTRHYEYPFSYHRNCAPLMLIAQLARDTGVKGLLSGEGSDELFLGYPWLGRKRITDAYGRLTSAVTSTVRKIPGFGPILAPDSSGNYRLVREILNGREMSDDLDLVADAINQSCLAQKDPTISWTLDYLHYHLRTLLHRNDTMGMAASIEARFPFLDNHVAKFGVNLPGRHKLRRSPFVLEKAHPFIRDKWVVREVANRYIPKDLSQRIKVGFWTTVFDRLDISPQYFKNSPLTDVLQLSNRQLVQKIEAGNPDLALRLMLTDVWVASVLEGEDMAVTVNRLRDGVKIRPEGSPQPKTTQKIVRAPVAPV